MVKQNVSESFICMFLDAMPLNLEFEVTELRFIDMLPRHCGLEVTCTEAAQKMLDVEPPFDYAKINPRIYDLVNRIRGGAELECDYCFPAAALGVLWSWQLIHEHGWSWCALSQHWWETIAVCDPDRRCAILPIQYFRWLGNDSGRFDTDEECQVDKWPEEYLKDIRNGQLPIDPNKQLTWIYK